MGTAKVAISMAQGLLGRLDRRVRDGTFPSRSKAIEEAVKDKLDRLDRSGLARECAKLDPKIEKALAEEGISGAFPRGDVVRTDLNPGRGLPSKLTASWKV